jgi:hypothetical protein
MPNRLKEHFTDLVEKRIGSITRMYPFPGNPETIPNLLT